jgi:predicted Zn-dependent protease
MTRPLQRSLLLAALMALPGAIAWPQAAAPPDFSGPVPRSVHSTLPDLGSSANAAISRAEEYQVGRMMMRDLRNQNALLDDVETADYLQTLGSRIAAEAQQGEQRLTFFAVRDRSINAFALPGGFVGFHTGLILLTNSEAELAGVVAHEVGHVVQRHIARAVEAQGRINLTSMAGMLAGVLIGAATGNADAIPGVLALGQGATMQQQINFTRMEEHEADRVGIGYLAAAGFDPNGMAGFFATMMRQRGAGGSEIPSLLLTHPVDTVRLAEARSRIAGMPEMPRRPESVSYAYIRERLRVLTAGTGSELRRYYERERASQPANAALRYGAALVETQSGNPDAAIALLTPLLAEQPQLPLLHIALAQAQLAAGQQQQGIASFEQALALSPRNVPLTVRYAEALLGMDQAKKSHQLLLDLFNNVAPTPEQIRLIALAASAAGDAGDAYAYMAELHLAYGDLPLAVTQLDLALAAPGLTEVQRKRFVARRDEIRDVIRESRGRGGRSAPRDEPGDGTRDKPRDTSRDGPRSGRS